MSFERTVFEQEILPALARSNSQAIAEKLMLFHESICAIKGNLFVSIGENCAVAASLRSTGHNRVGAGFFDNLVISASNVSHLIENNFSDILKLSNLHVSKWEGHDSVEDRLCKVFYHHYFIPRITQERMHECGIRRKICAGDIALF